MIEDDAVIAMCLRESLIDFGFVDVDVVYTHEDALGVAQSQFYALAAVDWRLGGETAHAAAAMLRDRGAALVFATAYDDAPREEFPHAIYLAKPFDDSALRDAFVTALKQHRKSI